MTQLPLVSIVIPTYNRARDLERALSSVVAQTFQQWEALVVDQHSSDDTDGTVAGFNEPRIKVYKIRNEGVIAASRNLALRYAQGKYVAFLDSDDWWSPRKLEQSVRYLDQGADVVYHDLYLVRRPHQKRFARRARTRELTRPVFRDLLLHGNALNNSSVVVRKELLDAIQGMAEDQTLIAAEDYDAWLRIAQRTEAFTRIPETLGYYWAGGGNTSNPERTIGTLGRIKERYADALRVFSGPVAVPWMNYARGFAYYRLGLYDMARESFRSIPWRGAPFSMTAKSRWMLWLLALRRHSVPRPWA